MASKTILVVEDEATQLLLLTLHLRDYGFRVLSAMNGLEGLQKAIDHRPDIILLDVILPGMNGLEVYQRLKENAGTCDIPVIMVTASRTTPDEGEDRLPVEHCLVKPYQLTALFEKIGQALPQLRSV